MYHVDCIQSHVLSCTCSFSRISFNEKCMDLDSLGAWQYYLQYSVLLPLFCIPSLSFGTRSFLPTTLSVSHPHSLSHLVPLAASGCLTSVPLPMCQGSHWTDNTSLMYVNGCVRLGRCVLVVCCVYVCACMCVYVSELVCYVLQMPVLSLFMCSLTQTSSASFVVRATSHYSDCWGRERRAAETYTHTHTQDWASGWEDVTIKSVTF